VWCDAGVRSLLSGELWTKLTSQGTAHTYETGQRLITEGQVDDGVIVLIEGRVKVTCCEEDGTPRLEGR